MTKNDLQQKFFSWLLRQCRARYYGVSFESGLPPEFVITPHAHERLKERFPTLPDEKKKKVVMKAWDSKQTSKKLRYKQRTEKAPDTKHKLFHGIRFIFRTVYIKKYGFVQKTLVTVIDDTKVKFHAK